MWRLVSTLRIKGQVQVQGQVQGQGTGNILKYVEKRKEEKRLLGLLPDRVEKEWEN